MTVLVLRPGLFSTLQDLGRYGLQHLGVVPCGAMDFYAHRMANTLVGNSDESATLECTIVGPELAFSDDSLVSICGASFSGGPNTLPGNRPVLVKAGARVSIGKAVRGSRCYLAIAGGFVVPEVLGSRSTYVPAQFGGYLGRPLQAGDRLETAPNLEEMSGGRFSKLGNTVVSGLWHTVRWSVPQLTVSGENAAEIRATEGRHYRQFTTESRQAFYSHAWRVSPNSNRMGYRLEGPRLMREAAKEVLSEPTCLGTVQVPNDGRPIVLMADHQTTGGYPKIAEVATVDAAMLAQLAPGAVVRFVKCTLDEALEAEDEMLNRFSAVTNSVRSMTSAKGTNG